MSATASNSKNPATSRSRKAPSAFFLRLLLTSYYPFLALIVVLNGAAVAGLLLAAQQSPHLGPFIALPAIVLSVTLLQLLWALRVLFIRLKDHDDQMELRVTADMAPKLYNWVEHIAAERDLPIPDDIRVSADTVAHVYERTRGQQVLVLGATAVRALPQDILAGIVAHELGHLAAGDTSLGRRAHRRHILMGLIEYSFHVERMGVRHHRRGGLASIAMLGALLNPAVWLLRLYHLLYALAHAAHSRQCEFAADRLAVEQSSPEDTARALVLVIVADSMPWTRLSARAQSWAASGQPAHQIFEEQERAARTLDAGTWQDAIRKELKKPTGYFDSHPGLKDRLAAFGVSSKKAIKMTPDLVGSPAHELFGKWWPKLEKRLAEKLLDPYRAAHLAKMEVGELMGALHKLEQRTGS